MGVVIRQGAKSSIVSYVSVFLGFVNTIVIYPLTLEIDQLGEIQFVLQTAFLLLPFLVFGFSTVSIKFFAEYNNSDEEKSGFLSFLYIPPLITGTLLLVIFYLFQDSFFAFFNSNESIRKEALNAIPLLAVLMSFAAISSSFSSNLRRIVVPNILNNLIKICLPVLCILYYYEIVSIPTIYCSLVVFYALLTIIFFTYIRYVGNLKLTLSFIRKLDFVKIYEMLKFAGFGVLATIGSQVATRIDGIMVTTLKSTYDNGVYTVAMFISNTVMVPLTLVAAIATPLIAGYWKTKDMEQLNGIYRKSSINLFVLGLGVFIAIWAALDGLFALMPRGDEFAAGKMVILILGMSKIIDMVTGLSSQILSMSPKYPVYFYMLLGLAFLNVFLNIQLIPIYGINGAAISTFISLTLFNLIKYLYIKIIFKLEPFTFDMLKVLMLGLVLILGIEFIPKFHSEWINLLFFPLLVLTTYVYVILKLNISEDLNSVYKNVLNRIRGFISR